MLFVLSVCAWCPPVFSPAVSAAPGPQRRVYPPGKESEYAAAAAAFADLCFLRERLRFLDDAVRRRTAYGDTFEGSFFIRMPPDSRRLSDFLNLTPRFIYLCLDQNDRILNKDYLLSVKHSKAL